jgi:adenylate kinase family enzyme
LREEVAAGSPLGKKINGVIKEGKLVSSDMMVDLIQKRI